MTALFVSDLHLDSGQQHHLRALDKLLDGAVRSSSDIYILGDLVEVWVGDDDDDEFADELRSLLRRHGSRTSMSLMHGNRDFLFGAQFVSDIGATLLEDPSVIELGGQRVLLAHGDAYCTSDIPYQQLRRHFRSDEFQEQFLAQDLEARREFARSMREQSRRSNANKPDQITDVVEDEVRSSLKEFNCTTMIHGHTHRPGIHHLGGNFTRIVLGSWERCGWYCRYDTELELVCFGVGSNGQEAS